MPAGPRFCTFWTHFQNRGAPGHLPWNLPGAPKRALGATLAHISSQTPKTMQKNTFRGPFWGPTSDKNDYLFLGFAFTCHSDVAGDVQMTPKLLEEGWVP